MGLGKMMLFLIAYDIANPSRLQRVARRLEKQALRCQKSVFLFQGTAVALATLLETVAPVLNLREDIVQAWRLAEGQEPMGVILGTPLHLYPSGTILSSEQPFFLEQSK